MNVQFNVMDYHLCLSSERMIMAQAHNVRRENASASASPMPQMMVHANRRVIADFDCLSFKMMVTREKIILLQYLNMQVLFALLYTNLNRSLGIDSNTVRLL